MRDCEIFCVYRIVSDKGDYIGITLKRRLKIREYQHRRNGRFGNFVMYSIYETKDKSHAEYMEEEFIRIFDSFENGLNKTIDGKGVCKNSNNQYMVGQKFSKESRKKMSETRKRLLKEGKVKIPERTPEQIRKTAEIVKNKLKGTIRYEIPQETIEKIFELYNERVPLGRDYPVSGEVLWFKNYLGAFAFHYSKIYKIRPRGIIELIEGKYKTSKVMSDEQLIQLKKDFSNEIPLPFEYVLTSKPFKSYERAFSHKFSSEFGISHVTLFNILTDKRGKYDSYRK